jgi:nicotinate dehydrogenase subunit A
MSDPVEDEVFVLTVNGTVHEVACDRDASLLHVLRNRLGLVGARFGCGVGLCGACFVLLDGHPTPSCDTPIWSAQGHSVVTVEGLGGAAGLHPVQQAFLDEQAAQCGYCVSGVVVSAAALLADQPRPAEAEVVAALDRNLCRCGVQRRMVRAVLRAADESRRP